MTMKSLSSSKVSSASPMTTELKNLHAPVEIDGKNIPPVSTLEFALMAVFGVPLWLTVLVPLSAVYQAGKTVVNVISPTKNNNTSTLSIDSGYQVSKTDLIPRSDRKYDVVLLGSTGFTGRLGALHLAKTYGVGGDIKWAIAGRSKDKLQKVKEYLVKELDNPNFLDIPTIQVDTSIISTMPGLVRDTRAVVTTAGPFRRYGSPVVEFCAKFGTHYADITGETDWAETMMKRWNSKAKETGAKIISFCGCDSIPWDLSVYQLAQTLQNEVNEDLVSVDCVDELLSGPSGGTLETMKLAINGNDLPTDDFGNPNPFRKTADGNFHANKYVSKPQLFFSKLQTPWKTSTTTDPAYGSFFIMSLVNAKVVGWTHALRKGAPLTYSECQYCPDFKSAFVGYFGIIAYLTALLNPISSVLLYNFFLPKTGEGPSMEKMKNDSYCSVYAKGVGTNGSKVESVMYFPACVGYLETARMVVESGLSLALTENELPSKGGGFYSPSYGLGTVLLDRLKATGTYFNVEITSRAKANK